MSTTTETAPKKAPVLKNEDFTWEALETPVREKILRSLGYQEALEKKRTDKERKDYEEKFKSFPVLKNASITNVLPNGFIRFLYKGKPYWIYMAKGNILNLFDLCLNSTDPQDIVLSLSESKRNFYLLAGDTTTASGELRPPLPALPPRARKPGKAREPRGPRVSVNLGDTVKGFLEDMMAQHNKAVAELFSDKDIEQIDADIAKAKREGKDTSSLEAKKEKAAEMKREMRDECSRRLTNVWVKGFPYRTELEKKIYNEMIKPKVAKESLDPKKPNVISFRFNFGDKTCGSIQVSAIKSFKLWMSTLPKIVAVDAATISRIVSSMTIIDTTAEKA